jgi:hypothetical protein
MNKRNKMGSVLGGAAVIAGIVSMTAGIAPASAAPAPSGATLSVVNDIVDSAYIRLIISGLHRMEEPDAVGFITHLMDNGCGGMNYAVYADDGTHKILLDRTFPGTSKGVEGDLWASRRGLEYRRELTVPKGFLNENLDGVDRIYVRAIFKDGDCAQRIQITNVAEGDY